MINPESIMKNQFIFGVVTLFLLAGSGCSTNHPGPEITGPEPEPSLKFIERDSVATGDYRGISVHSTLDDAFAILEDYREKQMITYLGAVNNYFSDITDIENRIGFFEWVVLDQKSDTENGVQIQLEAGAVKSLRLNKGKELTQWPETADPKIAVRINDPSDLLYSKLVVLSNQPEFSRNFERIVLTTKYEYAIYDPVRAEQPWTFIYWSESEGRMEQVRLYFKDKKVHYFIVDHFEQI